MENYKNLEGKIKTIRITMKNGSTLVSKEESGIIVSCKEANSFNSSKYRIEGISLIGKSFAINIDDNAEILDLIVDEEKSNYLLEIRDSILRKREAQEILNKEKANIEALKIKLLSNAGILTQDNFVKNLNIALNNLNLESKISVQYRCGYADISIRVNECILYIWVKKHHIEHIRIVPIKYFCRENLKLEVEELKDSKSHKKFTSMDDKRFFLEKYEIEDFFSEEYYNFINQSNICINDYSNVNIDENGVILYLFSHYLYKENKEFSLSNSTIDSVTELVEILSKCKVPC